MNDFVVTPPFLRIALWAAMETMHLHISGISFFWSLNFFCIQRALNKISTNEKLSWGARLVKLDAGVLYIVFEDSLV